MAHKLVKYYAEEIIGTKNYRGVLPDDIDKALSLLKMEEPTFKSKEKLLFAAARKGLDLPPVK